MKNLNMARQLTTLSNYSSPDGGFLVEFENEDAQLWDRADEDMILIARNQDQQ